MENDPENEAVDIESVDETRPAADLMESSSTAMSGLLKGHPTSYKEIVVPAHLDPESQKLIKKMLQEERRYIFGRTAGGTASKQTEKGPSTFRRDNKVSHNQRWSEEERQLFLDALSKYGRRWKKIAEMIGTRTPQQVKSFSRYLSIKGLDGKGQHRVGDPETLNNTSELPRATPKPDVDSEKEGRRGEQVKIKSGTESDENEEIDILNDSDEEILTDDIQVWKVPVEEDSGSQVLCSEGNLKKVDVKGEVPDDIGTEAMLGGDPFGCKGEVCREDGGILFDSKDGGNDRQVEAEVNFGETQNTLASGQSCFEKVEVLSQNPEEAPLDAEPMVQKEEEAVMGAVDCLQEKSSENGETLPIGDVSPADLSDGCHDMSENTAAAPGEEECLYIAEENCSDRQTSGGTLVGGKIHFDRDVISEEEKLVHKRFFVDYGKEKANNPTRYLLIRNTILDKWEHYKPRFVTKAMIRSCIGKCDVNTIGHIHDYLEQIGAINYMTPEEQRLDISEITDEEKRLNPEFFFLTDKRRKKTPDKYLKIRNFFVNLWETSKPTYVSKTLIRGAMRNYGDVTTVSNIHANLEALGLINVGVENPYKNISKKKKEKWAKRKEANQGTGGIPEAAARKSQRSCTKPEMKEKEPLSPEPKRPKKASKPRYDPFKLLECHPFTESSPAPFAISIEADALALMDLHAHLSSAEVIGLLGGNYDLQGNRLSVGVAKPCKSLSTGLQCEMDPVSQTEASVQIMSSGQQVVGWYHSHPAFLPNPSVRDVETQAEFQSWFGQGGAPFVGIIISPYQRITDFASMVNCLMVKQVECSTEKEYQPFRFEFTTSVENANPSRLFRDTVELMKTFQGHPSPVLLNEKYNNSFTYLEKTVSSICSHYCSPEHKRTIKEGLASLILSSEGENNNRFKEKTAENVSDHDHG